MLVLSRMKDQKIVIGDNIVITIIQIRGDKVRIGIEAPTDISIHRNEISDRINGENFTKQVQENLKKGNR